MWHNRLEISFDLFAILKTMSLFPVCIPPGTHSRFALDPPLDSFPATRSSAQGNCSAKSLASNVTDSSLSSLSSTGGGIWGVQGVWQQGVGEGEGG